MQKIGFLGMGVMGLPMAKNVVQKCGLPVLGYDVVQQQMDAFREAGGIPVSDPAEIYKACDVILQILPTHPIIRNSVEQAIQYGKPGNVIVDLSSTAPDIILELYQQAKDAGMFLLDSPVSGGNPMAIAGTLAIMTGGDKEAFDKAGLIYGMGHAVYSISDPRAKIMESFAAGLSSEKGREDEYNLYMRVARLAPEVIGEKRRIYKGVSANVDFYSGFIYSMLGLPMELYTPIFACARIAGWSAHRIEELINAGKIIRPAYKYVGRHRGFTDLDERG